MSLIREVEITDSVLPGGASTEAKQDDIIAVIQSDAVEKYKNVSVQYPIPADGDSIYYKDIDVSESDNGNFSGVVTDYFDSLTTFNEDLTVNNPKSITIWFERTVQTAAIGFGCNDLVHNFSNITVDLLGSGKVVRQTIGDAADNTKYNSLVLNFTPQALNGVTINFNTADIVCLSNLIIFKSENVNARLQAIKPDLTLTDIGATNYDNLRVSVQEYGDTPSVDAFARLRVSENFTIFDSKQLHDKQPLFWDEETGGSATSVHVPADASTLMSVTASATDYVIRQTKQRFNYQPGKSQLVFFTFLCNCEPGIIKRLGLFSGTGANNLTPDNGIFFETGNTPRWNICKNGTTTESVIQDDWNVDKLDGTGRSGVTIDLDATQIAVIDFEWLGVGRVRTGFVIDGLIYYTHYFNHANDVSFDSVYMSTPNLPVRYSIEGDGVATSSLSHICSSVISEGGLDKTGILRSVDNGAAFITGLSTATEYALLGIRLKSTHLDVTVIPEAISVIAGTSDAFRWRLHLNPILTNALTYSDLANSSVQEASGSTANQIATDGIVVGAGYASLSTRQTDAELKTALRIGSTIAGAADELVLTITPISNNMSTLCAMTFRELL